MALKDSHLFTRREFLKMSGAALAAAGLSACNSLLLNQTHQQNGKIQLVYQDWRTNWFPPMTQQVLQEFHDTHPNINVFYIPDPANLEDQMLVDMQSGTAPDVFQGCCTHFPTWAQQGYTLDLRPFVAADLDQETIAEWDPVQYNALFTRSGVQFGLPKYHGELALFYNKDVFDQYRVDYPDGSWNYEDYLNAMQQLTHDQNDDGRTDLWGSMLDISWDRIQVYANAWGGHFVDPVDPTRCRMGDPEAMAALEWLRSRMWDDRVMATLPDVNRLGTHQAFVAGKLAMVEDGSWALKDILSSARFRIGVAPFPAGPKRRATLVTTDGFGIYAGTKYPEAAWVLMKFLISKDYGRAMAKANFLQPARVSLVDDWIGFIREEYPEQTREMDLASFAEGQRQGYSVVAEIFANMADAKRMAQEAWDQILTLGLAPTDSMITAAEQIQKSQTQ